MGWRAVALDLRGHGDSAWSGGGDYRSERFADDLVGVARELADRPSLIGASLGGLAGLCTEAVIAPGTFSSLTLDQPTILRVCMSRIAARYNQPSPVRT